MCTSFASPPVRRQNSKPGFPSAETSAIAEQNVTQGASQLLEEVIRLLRSYVSKLTPNRYEAREDPALDTLHD